jgi:metal-dependent amidase/aminoacylase/carboxypeptidase family protein
MASLVEKIKSLSISLAQETVGNRHHLHMHPELSFQETATQAYVEQQLQAWGITTSRLANTGVVAFIEGKNPT